MNKFLVAIIGLIIISNTSFSQAREPIETSEDNSNGPYSKGNTVVGGFVGGNFFGQFWNVNAVGTYGKFVINRLAVAGTGFANIGFGNQTYSFGPQATYYILNNQISPVVEVNLQYYTEKNTYGLDTRTKGYFSQALAGVNYVGFGGLGATLLLNYNLLYDLEYTEIDTGNSFKLAKPQRLGTTFRINYFF